MDSERKLCLQSLTTDRRKDQTSIIHSTQKLDAHLLCCIKCFVQAFLITEVDPMHALYSLLYFQYQVFVACPLNAHSAWIILCQSTVTSNHMARRKQEKVLQYNVTWINVKKKHSTFLRPLHLPLTLPSKLIQSLLRLFLGETSWAKNLILSYCNWHVKRKHRTILRPLHLLTKLMQSLFISMDARGCSAH